MDVEGKAGWGENKSHDESIQLFNSHRLEGQIEASFETHHRAVSVLHSRQQPEEQIRHVSEEGERQGKNERDPRELAVNPRAFSRFFCGKFNRLINEDRAVGVKG